MTDEQWNLLVSIGDSQARGAFAMSCDGRRDRKLAHQLESHGYAEWKGTNWGSTFYALTDAGRKRIDAGRGETKSA